MYLTCGRGKEEHVSTFDGMFTRGCFPLNFRFHFPLCLAASPLELLVHSHSGIGPVPSLMFAQRPWCNSQLLEAGVWCVWGVAEVCMYVLVMLGFLYWLLSHVSGTVSLINWLLRGTDLHTISYNSVLTFLTSFFCLISTVPLLLVEA